MIHQEEALYSAFQQVALGAEAGTIMAVLAAYYADLVTGITLDHDSIRSLFDSMAVVAINLANDRSEDLFQATQDPSKEEAKLKKTKTAWDVTRPFRVGTKAS